VTSVAGSGTRPVGTPVDSTHGGSKPGAGGPPVVVLVTGTVAGAAVVTGTAVGAAVGAAVVAVVAGEVTVVPALTGDPVVDGSESSRVMATTSTIATAAASAAAPIMIHRRVRACGVPPSPVVPISPGCSLTPLPLAADLRRRRTRRGS
jgi:hypothetical protein